ncbi:MAG: hypothetical protein SA339_07165 [Methanomassiliicoccus sp.]|nr:hypothetical protein [Methanomassiliicoccus sp.]
MRSGPESGEILRWRRFGRSGGGLEKSIVSRHSDRCQFMEAAEAVIPP